MKVAWKLPAAAILGVICAVGARLAYEANKVHVGTRVLFVGNSFTFVNNLPAVFAALSRSNGFPVTSEMLAESSAAIADRVADGSLRHLLERDHYDYVVLQERAGALHCGPRELGPGIACEVSRRAHHAVADLAREHGTKPIVLGTYAWPELASQLEADEATIAHEIGAAHVPIANQLLRGLQQAPRLDWLAADAAHPGSDLTLLDAVLLYRTIFASLPKNGALAVHAPIYDISTAMFTLDWRTVRAASNEYVYDAQRVAAVVQLATKPQ